MPKGDGIQTQISVGGDKEYKQALKDISRQLTVLNSDMQASQSVFGDNATSMDALKSKLQGLKSIYDVQKSKVELLSGKLQQLEESGRGNSTEADNLRIALNKATTQMNKTGTEIGRCEDNISTLSEAEGVMGDESL